MGPYTWMVKNEPALTKAMILWFYECNIADIILKLKVQESGSSVMRCGSFRGCYRGRGCACNHYSVRHFVRDILVLVKRK